MPIYEYLCHDCHCKIALYVQLHSQNTPSCSQCGSSNLQRLFSTFAVRKTDNDIYRDILDDNQLTRGMMQDDPKALAEWNKRMSRGEKVPEEYEGMVYDMERGNVPTNLPDLDTLKAAD